MKDARSLFSKNDCKIIDDSKNDIINYKGTLDECKVKCASYADCNGFNRGKDVFHINNAECILKKISFLLVFLLKSSIGKYTNTFRTQST